MHRFGRFEIRPAERVLLIDGAPAALGARAFDLLLALAERSDRVVSKRELIDLVWPDVVVEENNLQVQVSALRKLLGQNALATLPGRGYRFTLARADAGTAASTPPAATPAAPALAAPGNLSAQAPALIDRDAALRDLLARIEEHALVALVGAGGIGKTSLALAAAAALRDDGRFRDGVWWVDLTPLTDAALVAQAVAQALRAPAASAGATALQQLAAALRGQQLLLVLDNCEQVVEGTARLAEALTAEAPGVHVLATSRELLNVHGEHVLRLDPLSLPAAGEAVDERRHGAVALFVERARAADPRFALGADNAEAVADICRHLDGLPLAIELAAARVRLLGVQGVRDRLDERFKVLTGGARTAERRHQTLHATLDWSHALLKPTEQAVLRRLGVFVGGFPLGLAQQVCADDTGLDEWAVLEALATLVDKSMVAVDAGEPVRYRLLESTRAYALERLADCGETAALQRRHMQAVRALFVAADDARFGDGGTLDLAGLMRRLAPEIDNWRAAFDCVDAPGGDWAAAVALAGSGAFVLRNLGLSQEALERLLPLRARVDEVADPAAAFAYWWRLGMLGSYGRLPRTELLQAAAHAEQLARALGSRRRLIVALDQHAWSLNMVEEHAAAQALLDEAGALERAGDPAWLRAARLNVQATIHAHEERFERSVALLLEMEALLLHASGEEIALATCRNNLCMALNGLGRFDEAVAAAESALACDGVGAGHPLAHLLHAQVALGRLDAARATLRRALPLWRRDGLLLASGWQIACLLAALGQHANAARVAAAADFRAGRSGMQLHHVQLQLYERLRRDLLAAQVSATELALWQREGEALDEAQAAAICEAVG